MADLLGRLNAKKLPPVEICPAIFASHPLVDVYTPDQVGIWLKLILFEDWDLELEECATDSWGELPKWYDSNDGSDPIFPREVIDAGYMRIPWKGEMFQAAWIEWALREGICPGQPFVMRLDTPIWTGGGYYEPNEYDVSYEWDIAYRMPYTAAESFQAWDSALADIHQWRDEHVEHLRKVRYEQQNDVTAMKLQRRRYNPLNDYEDGGYSKQGARWNLVTTHGAHYQGVTLAQGSDDGNDYDKAFEALCVQVAEKLPHISRPDLERLRDGAKLAPSVWARLVG